MLLISFAGTAGQRVVSLGSSDIETWAVFHTVAPLSFTLLNPARALTSHCFAAQRHKRKPVEMKLLHHWGAVMSRLCIFDCIYYKCCYKDINQRFFRWLKTGSTVWLCKLSLGYFPWPFSPWLFASIYMLTLWKHISGPHFKTVWRSTAGCLMMKIRCCWFGSTVDLQTSCF